MAVGEKVGVGSLRRSMVDQSLTRLDFGVGAGVGESFGQQESLTRRLKHILQMYPEGPRYDGYTLLKRRCDVPRMCVGLKSVFLGSTLP